MYSFLVRIFLTILFLPFNDSTATEICVNRDGTNITCQPACLSQPCNRKWSCNETLLNTCEQACYQSPCTQLSCNEMAQKCDQFCVGCQNMKCNSSNCYQRCTAGYCEDITCNHAQSCVQLCQHCAHLRCNDANTCTQTCMKSNCSLDCVHSQGCRQNCNGNGCQARCHGREHCFQTCGRQATCTDLVCKSNYCHQTCLNTSACDLLFCDGELCKQETYVEKSKLECKSAFCRDQVSRVSNTILHCDNIDGSCDQKCYGSACSMSCGKNVKKCDQTCYGGYCNMSCTGSSEECKMNCPGGKCVFSCQAKNCLLSCEKNDCKTDDETDEEDNREKCNNSSSRHSFELVLCVIFTSFAFLSSLF